MSVSLPHFFLRRFPLVILPLGLLSPLPALGTELHHWISHQDGVYENPAAWVPASTPDGADAIALFGQATDLTIGLTDSHTLSALQLANKTNVTFKPAVATENGQRGDNRLLAAENTTVEDAFLRLHSVGANSADVVLDVEDTLAVNGHVHTVHGARINADQFLLGTSSSLDSSAWISGSDAATGPSRVRVNTIRVGDRASASLRLDAGGALNSHIAYVGANVPLQEAWMSRVEVRGTGANGATLWDANAVVVGNKGMGRVSALDGGEIHAQTLALGTGPSNEPGDLGYGLGDVAGTAADGTPARMEVESLVVGVRGRGAFSVADGGQLHTQETFLARAPGSETHVDLYSAPRSPVATWMNSGDVAVGGDREAAGGTAEVRVRAGSLADVRGEMHLWPGSRVSVEGGTLATHRMLVDGGGDFEITSGTIQLDEYEGVDLLQRGGAIAPGPGAGKSLILSNFTQRGGATTAIEIGGPVPGESHDRIAIDGNAILNGTLALSLIDDFVPAEEDTFSVVTSNQLFGAYQNVTNGGRVALDDGSGSFVVNYGWQSAFDPHQVVLSDYMRVIFGDFNADGTLSAADIDMLQVGLKDAQFDLTNDNLVDVADRLAWVEQVAGTSLGDTDLDGKVDFTDFLALSDGFGAAGGWARGDFDGSGRVDFSDFLALSANFGQTATAPVPEPSSELLVCFGLLGTVGFFRRRQR